MLIRWESGNNWMRIGWQFNERVSWVEALLCCSSGFYSMWPQLYVRAKRVRATIFNNGEYGPLACTGKYGASGPKAAIYVRDRIGDNGKIFNDKNPYDTNNFAVKRGGTWVLGQVTLLANPTTLSLYTCFKEPCNLNANKFRLDISIP